MLVTGRDSTVLGLYDRCRVPIFRIHFEQLKVINPKALTRLTKSVKQFKQLINKLRPEIVLANTTRALILAALCKQDYYLICYVRDYDYPRWLIGLLKKRVDKFLFVSKSIRQFYELNGEVVYLGTEIRSQKSRLAAKLAKIKSQNFKQALGIKKTDLVVGFVGRLVEWKGAGALIDAIARLNNPKVKLLVFGTGEIEESLKARLQSERLGDKVKLMGFMGDRGLIYQAINIFVLPSQAPEPFATTMIEAAKFGLPIIATNTGGTKEFIKNTHNGLLVKAGSVEAIKKALVKLTLNKKLRQQLGRQARIDAQAFTEKRLTAKLERIYLCRLP